MEAASTQTSELPLARRKSIFWPKRLLGPPPGLKELNLVCWSLFLAFLVLPICVIYTLQAVRGEKATIQLRSDFVLYYGVGTLANQYPVARTYNPDLQRQKFSEIFPLPEGSYGVSPYPPFVPLFFRVLARLPFNTAYFLWAAISLALYCAGIGAALAAVFPGERLRHALIVCFALAYSPFLGDTLANGQLASIAACGVGLALLQEKSRRCFLAGLALAMLAYKPTLLLLILPMLLITRRYKHLAGFFAGAAALFLIGTAYGGWKVWPAYLNLLRYNSHLAGLHGAPRIKLESCIDLNSISRMVPGGRTPIALPFMAVVALIIAVMLVFLLRKSAHSVRSAQWLAWAATLTWTLLLNVYVPIYDSVLAVIAVILTLGALRELRWSRAAEWTTALAVVIFAISWKTESFAAGHKVQLLTLALLVLGVAQLAFLKQALRQQPA